MANILLDENASIKLCDFGLCELIQPGETSNVRCGTPVTMAPEVVNGVPYTLTPDWWSVGIVIYQLMNKKSPYEGKDVQDLM